MVADAITQVERFIDIFVSVYVLAIIAYIITSWVRMPYSLQPVARFLYDVCEPYLRLWRRLLPFSVGPIDFSPIVGIIALGIAAQIVTTVLDALH